MNIAIIGAGAYGKVLGATLEKNQHQIKFYDPFVYPNTTIEEVVNFGEIIIFVAPANTLEATLPKIPKTKHLVVACKGLLSDKILQGYDYSLLGGAGFAKDFYSNLESEKCQNPIILTCSNQQICELLTTKNQAVIVEYFADAKAILLCGALKNIYAIGAGEIMPDVEPGWTSMSPKFVDDKHYGNFTLYIQSVLNEMSEILEANNADSEAVNEACGKPDLILTCAPESRNFTFGQLMVKNPDEAKKHANSNTTEGVYAISNLPEDFVIPESCKLLATIRDQVNAL